MNMVVFWVVAWCSLVDFDQSLREAYCLNTCNPNGLRVFWICMCNVKYPPHRRLPVKFDGNEYEDGSFSFN